MTLKIRFGLSSSLGGVDPCPDSIGSRHCPISLSLSIHPLLPRCEAEQLLYFFIIFHVRTAPSHHERGAGRFPR
jgi:hypothetical protein